jgi:23S rRNA pseudouridine2605 synthase
MKTGAANKSKNDLPGRVSLARALSKLGFCSRSQAPEFITAGRVKVNQRVEVNPSFRVNLASDRIEVDEKPVKSTAKVYLLLNKPRGLVTTRSDEKGRETVYECLKDENLPAVMPVGRLDKASEGLLLFTNDTHWANRILDPENHLDKIYHVQINCLADENLLRQLKAGGRTTDGDFLNVKEVKLLRSGKRNCWLEITLDEGKNRHIRRLLQIFDIEVLRLIRVAIGPFELGNLKKGEFRYLSSIEKEMLVRPANSRNK